MKVLILSYKDNGGGAPTVAYRLAYALNNYLENVHAVLGVVEKTTSSDFVEIIPRRKQSKLKKIYIKSINFFICSLFKLFPLLKKIFEFHTTNAMGISKNFKSLIDVNWINSSDFDIVNIHWAYFDMISIKDISKINKPILWTMHDSWICCGAELHPNILENDTRYKEKFSKRNRLPSQSGIDIDKKVWKLKEKYLRNRNIFFHAPSLWEANILKESYLFHDRECSVIPNIVNHEDFHPMDKLLAKKILNIPLDKKVLGFGAISGIDNPKSLKGPKKLIEALNSLRAKNDYFLVVFGDATVEFTKYLTIPFFCSGLVKNSRIMALIYNACDVIVNPSLIENLPTVCVEAISCGVPVAAFDAGGTCEVVEHKVNGYVAKCYDSNDLSRGIEYCYQNRERLGKAGIAKSKKDYDTKTLLDKYISLYSSIIKYGKVL